MKNYIHARLTPEESKYLAAIKKCTGASESEIVRRALKLVYNQEVENPKSAYDIAKKYAGIYESGVGDLSYNKKHMDGFGK